MWINPLLCGKVTFLSIKSQDVCVQLVHLDSIFTQPLISSTIFFPYDSRYYCCFSCSLWFLYWL